MQSSRPCWFSASFFGTRSKTPRLSGRYNKNDRCSERHASAPDLTGFSSVCHHVLLQQDKFHTLISHFTGFNSNLRPVSVKRGKGEGLSDILPKKPTFLDDNVIDFIAGVKSIRPMPSFGRSLALLSPGSVHQQSYKGGYTWAYAIVRQQGVFKFILADNQLCVFYVHLCFCQEHLYVLGDIGSIVFHCPRSQNCFLILNEFELLTGRYRWALPIPSFVGHSVQKE